MAAESLSFELKLVDAVTAPGKRAADALRQIEMRAKKASSALDFSKEMSRVENNLKRLSADPRGYVSLIKAQKELKESRNKLLEDAGLKKPETFAQGLMSRFSFAKLAGAAAVGELVTEGAFKVAESLVEGAREAVEVITDGVKDAFKSAGKEQTQRISEKMTLGAGATGFREDAERFAKNTPFTSSEIRGLMLPLRRAGLSQAAARQAFATASDIGGGNPEAVGGILDQFKRIYTKQGIGKKQLQELLGNVGETIPDFYKALGKKMHITASEAEKRAEQGGLDPQLIMNMITEAQNKKQGGKAGTGALEYSKSLEAHWHKLIELPDEYYRKLVDSPGFSRANEMLGQLLEKLDPESPTGQRIMASIDEMFTKITNAFGGSEDGVDGIVDSIQEMIGLVGDLIPDLKTMGEMLMASAETIADIIRGARLAMAISSGDTATAQKLLIEEGTAAIEKKAREFARENRHKATQDEAFNLLAGGLPGLVEGKVSRRDEGKTDPHFGDSVTVNNHFHGDVSDADEVGRKAADGTRKGVSRGRRHRGG